MKKYLYSALALPLLFACSTEEIEKPVVNNDQFAGIEKVDATFTMDEGATTRFDGVGGEAAWTPQEGDLWGFAWEGDGTVVPVGTGVAKQNHNLIQTNGIFTPQTSIFVGDYFLYRPYDETTVSPQAINFKSLEEQPLAEGFASTTQAWKDLAKKAINIGDKWTNVTAGGWTDAAGNKWDEAGIKKHYKIYAAMFSNQTGLDLTYVKNNPTFAAAATITGATDINYSIAAGTEVGSADIYEATVDLNGQAKSFTYAPSKAPNTAAHNGEFWADKKGLPTAAQDGFTFAAGAVKLIPADATNGLSTGADASKAWFWFNSLPNTAGTAVNTDNVTTVFTTSYGVVTVTEQLKDCAYAFEQPKGAAASAPKEWIKLAAATDQTKTPKEWDPAVENTFVNQYGNHKGKYALTVDFSTGVMNDMHIKNDTHLQKLLKYYLASGKSETVSLNLDGASATDKTFKLSKISIALLQTLNAAGKNVKVHACGTHNNPVKIIVTQDGSDGKTEVPDLNNVFDAATDVYLASNTTWTWKQRTGLNQLTVDANVASLTNEGTLTVNADNIDLSIAGLTITNAAGATMNITKVTTAKTALTNLGTINVGAADNTAAELRAYNATITNDATSLTAYGTINNYGVVGKSAGTTGQVDNYGHINMKNNGAITLLNSNEKNGNTAPDGPFKTAFVAGTNMMGTVVLPEGNPYALVSVSNTDETGFIKYNWTAATYTHDTGNVKYNTIIVSNNIAFTGAAATEIKFIEFDGTRTQVVNPAASDKLPNLKGVIVNPGKSFILEKTNVLDCYDGAFLGSGATIYRGGDFLHQGANFATAQTNNYLGTWSLDQIVEY